MKVAEKKKKRRDVDPAHEAHRDSRSGGDLQSKSAHQYEYIYDDTPRTGALSSGLPRDERQILTDIDEALEEIEVMRESAHSYDGEIARLGAETRRLIEEMRDELKAA